MNSYEEKQEAKRERLEDRAIKKHHQADERRAVSDSITSGIPFGQPILIGHHSEKAHRNRLERSHRAMGKSIELDDEAQELERRAAAVGSGGISSDDPEAIAKLKNELAGMATNQEEMKRINSEFKKGGVEGITGLDDEQRAQLQAGINRDWRAKPKPFESYMLSNNSANMRRIKGRIADLEARAGEETTTETISGVEVVHNVEANRLQLFFEGKPDDDIRTMLKRGGFRWARSIGAWQRHLSNAADYIAADILKAYEGE